MARERNSKILLFLPLLGIAAGLVVSCTNSRRTISSVSVSASGTPGSGPQAVIDNVTIASNSGPSPLPSATSTSSYVTTIYFDTVSSAFPIASVCDLNNNLCACQFSWQQINSNNPTGLPITRNVLTPVSAIQQSLVTCNAPPIYGTQQLLTGSQITVSVVPVSPNANIFTATQFAYTVNTTGGTGGNFQDSFGNYFANIFHYSCYQQFKRGINVTSRIATATDPTTGDVVSFPMASEFCAASYSGNSGPTASCPNILPPQNSAQANYYNLYIRSTETGDINISNANYVCPVVQEQLQPPVGNSIPNFYPLDSNFALSVSPTQQFPLGVEAYIELSNGNDPTAQGNTCFPSTGGGSPTPSPTISGNNGTLVNSCLGFAAPPASNGTCPTFTLSTGVVEQTYRLRRYIALYPAIFDTNGSPLSQPQATDTVYVLDRPVTGPNGQVFTMKGPKPCPVSYFDWNSVRSTSTGIPPLANPAPPAGTSSALFFTAAGQPATCSAIPGPSYAATNDACWNGTNIDGIQFPNADTAVNCAAVIPIVNAAKTVLSLGTVNAANPIFPQQYIRPITSWSPHYEEDISFQACAPLSSPLVDPPLHFAKNANNDVAWCAEVYPTQNQYLTTTNNPITGAPSYAGSIPFTSHVIKNVGASANPACITSPVTGAPHSGLVTADPNSGAPLNDTKTCDRTVSQAALSWTLFPLLGDALSTENALKNDTSFVCSVTYDNGGATSAGAHSPTGGCCGVSTLVQTGPGNPKTAHWEPPGNPAGSPGQTCQIPAY